MAFSSTGIVDIEYALPKHYIKMEQHSGISIDKLKIGLMLDENGVLGRDESVVSLAREALDRLLCKTGIREEEIGRIDVGSETNPDSAKSIKTALMARFEKNKNMCGADNVQACYGGTAALLNALAWLESPFCNAKYAVVVCADAYFYRDPSLHPLSSAGAVAIALGRDPVFSVDYDVKSFFDDQYDFLKPKSEHPHTVINGKHSVELYQTAFQVCADAFLAADYHALHTPYPKLVKKTADAHGIAGIERTFALARRNGNTYTASLYMALISLLDCTAVETGRTIGMYSFGSGCSASCFTLRRERDGCGGFDVEERLGQREEVDEAAYTALVDEYFNKK